MSWLRTRLETNGNGELSEISVLVEGRGWSFGRFDGKVLIKYKNKNDYPSITLEMTEEVYRALKELLREAEKLDPVIEFEKKLFKLLMEFCEWTGKDLDEYVTQAVIEKLKGDCEEIASHGIPKAEEFLKRIEEFSS